MGLRFWGTCFVVLVSVSGWAGNASRSQCRAGRACTLEIPGIVCGDGTPAFVKWTERLKAKNLFIFLNGGGACWDKTTCKCDDSGRCQGGTASAGLTRPDPARFGEWDRGAGWRDSSDPKNPVAVGYSVLEVPYCTGDAFSGTHVVNHGTSKKPIPVYHKGYDNMGRILAEIKQRFPNPEKIVFMGCSAGGLGVTANLSQLVQQYPSTPSFVISDSGLPFKSPHVNAKRMTEILNTWGADAALAGIDSGPDGVLDLSDLIRENGRRFPHTRFAFLSAYHDGVMTFFASLLGSPYPGKAVENIMVDVADSDMAGNSNQNVFYLEGTKHCFVGKAPDQVVSEGVTLAQFADQMFSGAATWESVRPR